MYQEDDGTLCILVRWWWWWSARDFVGSFTCSYIRLTVKEKRQFKLLYFRRVLKGHRRPETLASLLIFFFPFWHNPEDVERIKHRIGKRYILQRRFCNVSRNGGPASVVREAVLTNATGVRVARSIGIEMVGKDKIGKKKKKWRSPTRVSLSLPSSLLLSLRIFYTFDFSIFTVIFFIRVSCTYFYR